ncbi:MAG: sensor histidine kinase [Sciscionella sp.]
MTVTATPAADVVDHAKRISLRTRVAWLAAACVAVSLALVSLGGYVTVSNSLYSQLDDTLQNRAVSALRSPVVHTQLQQIPGAFLSATDVRIGLLSASGDMRYPENGSPPPAGRRELAVARGTLASSLRTDQGTDSRVVALPAGPGQAMVLAQPLAPTEHTLHRLALVLIVVSGAGVVVAGLLGTAVAQGGLRPVLRLTHAAEHIARTRELRPIPVSGDDELARLTQSFNSMLAALAESQASQRQLVADAGHELRTPLTSLRTNIELLLASEKPGAPELSELDRSEIYVDVRSQLDELTTLIGDLVELAREDPPQQVREQIELTDVLERALDRARRRATNVDFVVSVQPWSMRGDASALERAVLNLLDNAVKFSPDGGQVSVTLRSLGDGSAALEVADSGRGIAEPDLPRVFDRFYRSSEARTLPGSGLGLAIVKQVAERHGGAAYAGSSPSGGALLTMRLPGGPGG